MKRVQSKFVVQYCHAIIVLPFSKLLALIAPTRLLMGHIPLKTQWQSHIFVGKWMVPDPVLWGL